MNSLVNDFEQRTQLVAVQAARRDGTEIGVAQRPQVLFPEFRCVGHVRHMLCGLGRGVAGGLPIKMGSRRYSGLDRYDPPPTGERARLLNELSQAARRAGIGFVRRGIDLSPILVARAS
jgi:hypothetical protein